MPARKNAVNVSTVKKCAACMCSEVKASTAAAKSASRRPNKSRAVRKTKTIIPASKRPDMVLAPATYAAPKSMPLAQPLFCRSCRKSL